MKILRRMAIPVIVLLSACGGSSDGDGDMPTSERPGAEVPALEDETTGQPSEPTMTPPGSEPAPGGEPGAETDPGNQPGTESGSGNDTDTESGTGTDSGNGSGTEPQTGTGADPVDGSVTEPETGTETDPGSETETGTDPDNESEPASGSEPETGSPPTDGNPSVPDPMTRNTTSVTFEITVPAYVSNELQVRITWGETTLAADWIGDESWSATVDLPSDEERLLVVDFLDRNGELPLGTFERDFRTGTNAAETYTVGPGNFDTRRWDSDRDGYSNLSELYVGSDPLSGDTVPAPIDIRPTGRQLTPLGALERVSAFYEGPLPKVRPYVESVEIRPADPDDYYVPRRTVLTEIDIDATGTGSFSSFAESRNVYDEDVRRTTLEATRTVADGVGWSGTYAWSVSSAGLSEGFAFSTRTSAVGERVSQQGTIEWKPRFWERQGTTDIEFDLLGERVDGTPLCVPVSGRVVIVETDVYFSDPDETPVSTTIFKGPDDADWSVEVRYEDGSLQGFPRESLDIELYCEFGDL